jgi:hypothetical protein
MLALFTAVAADAGAPDPDLLGGQLMLLHEGAVVTAGMQAVEDAFTGAAAAAAALLG